MIREKMLSLIDVTTTPGLEIGALNKPVVSRRMGPVEYIDRASREELQRWYEVNPEVDVNDIVPVDHVWGDQSLKECVGGREYGYLIASHVIEHVPDLFGWLGEIAAVLAPGGLAAFAVPDKRYTFDILRRTSGPAELVDAYVRGLRKPDARQIFDHFHHFRDLGSAEIRAGAAPADAPAPHPAREVMELCRKVQISGEYIDTHCWVFTPRSMLAVLDLGNSLGVLPFEIAALEPTPQGTNEFLLILRRLPDSLDAAGQRAAFDASRQRITLPEEGAGTDGEVETLAMQAHLAQTRLAAMEASTSWRITAPLRAAVTFARNLAGKG